METITINIDDYNKMNVTIVEQKKELDEIYNFDYKLSVMKLFTINDKGAMFARSIGGIGEALKGFILQFRHENEKNAKLTEENYKLEKEIEELEKENNKLKVENMSMKEMLCNVVAEKIDYDMSVDVYGQVDLNFHNTDIPQHIDIMKNIIKILTEHHNGDSQYSSYKNGFYYYKDNCFMKYILDYNTDVSCITYNEVEEETDDEEQ